jgi:hypothetical protein
MPRSIRTAALLAALLVCAFSLFSLAAHAADSKDKCRSSKGGFTAAALGEEFPELAKWFGVEAALGEEFPELVVFWPIPTTAALGEEFPELVRLPKTESLGEEFPE